jgi:hypothetical protein
MAQPRLCRSWGEARAPVKPPPPHTGGIARMRGPLQRPARAARGHEPAKEPAGAGSPGRG